MATILAIFDLQVILMFSTKFRVNWLLGLGEEAKNRFSRWTPWRNFGGHLGFSIGMILDIFDVQVTPMLPTKFGINCLLVEEKKQKIDFQDGGHGGHLGFPIGTILSIFNL